MDDIREILNHLNASGLSDADIGRAVAAPASIVQRLRVGTHKTTSYERAKRIIDFHKRVSRRKSKAAA